MKGRAWSLALAAGLVAVGLLTAFLLQPVQVSVEPPSTVTVTEPPQTGILTIVVAVQDFQNSFVPAPGVKVGISSITFPDVRASLVTNKSGIATFPAAPGQYGVEVTDLRFSAHANAEVVPLGTTTVEVKVQRTDYPVGFADAVELGGTGMVEPWQSLTVTLNTAGVQNSTNEFQAGENQTLASPLPSTVFVDSNSCCLGFGVFRLSETPASVVSQDSRGGMYFVDLRPLAPLELNGSIGLSLAVYSAVTHTTETVGHVG